MKIMKTTIAATVALAACAGTQLFAQNVKQDTITFALTLQGQSSVSTSSSTINAGNFSQTPLYYKTAKSSFNQASLLKCIAYVMHSGNANYYTSQATLQLVQGELGGFFNIEDSLAQSYPDPMPEYLSGGVWYTNGGLSGGFNQLFDSAAIPQQWDIADGTFYDENYYLNPVGWDGYPLEDAAYYELNSINLAQDGFPDADSNKDPYIYIGELATTVDLSSRTSISDGFNMFSRLDTGRHFLPVPYGDGPSGDDSTDNPLLTSGEYPPGHMQPWGQIYVRDPGRKDASGNVLCENVTFFFCLEVEECYDCFYLNSFVTDATFKTGTATQSGPPCCTPPGFLTGKGTDSYYLTLSFDNTIQNCYLNNARYTNASVQSNGIYYYPYVGINGIYDKGLVADGVSPDLLVYSDPIRSHLGTSLPYECRFTLAGIVTYGWTLTLVNTGDAAYDYVGSAKYVANGYGFIGLVCDLITVNSFNFTEKVVKDIGCCDDETWWSPTHNFSFGLSSLSTGWYGPGYNASYSPDSGIVYSASYGYFSPSTSQYNPYPYYNIVGGEVYPDYGITPSYVNDLPFQMESPYNPGPALTSHGIVKPCCLGNMDTESP